MTLTLSDVANREQELRGAIKQKRHQLAIAQREVESLIASIDADLAEIDTLEQSAIEALAATRIVGLKPSPEVLSPTPAAGEQVASEPNLQSGFGATEGAVSSGAWPNVYQNGVAP